MTDLKPLQENVSGFPEIPPSMHYSLRRAYWAALLFSDAQISTVLQAVEEVGAMDSTIFVVVGGKTPARPCVPVHNFRSHVSGHDIFEALG